MTESLLPLLPLLILILSALGLGLGLLVATHGADFLRQKKFRLGKFEVGHWIGPDAPVDPTPYECGMQPFERTQRYRFSIHFYIVAMLFILFDIEAAFLYPWAVTFREFAGQAQVFVLAEMGVFMGILILGFIYVWQRGALDWE
jgi:NADH-quinone oxidoreductase subunit A